MVFRKFQLHVFRKISKYYVLKQFNFEFSNIRSNFRILVAYFTQKNINDIF
jgi:hypothetical protein